MDPTGFVSERTQNKTSVHKGLFVLEVVFFGGDGDLGCAFKDESGVKWLKEDNENDMLMIQQKMKINTNSCWEWRGRMGPREAGYSQHRGLPLSYQERRKMG